MRRPDPGGHAVPGARGGGQAALPDARRREGLRGNRNALRHGLYTREAIAERRAVRQLIRDGRQFLAEIAD
jgi:hypothetical protein